MARKNGAAPHKKGPGSASTQFKPGQPGGPGRPRIPEDERQLRKEIQAMRGRASYSWATAWAKYHDATRAQLEKLQASQDLPSVELTVVRARLLIISKPRMKDIAALQKMECGLDPKQFEVSGPGGEPLTPFSGVDTKDVETVVEALLMEAKACSTQTTSNSSPALARRSPRRGSRTAK